jgi:hypothetical protein
MAFAFDMSRPRLNSIPWRLHVRVQSTTVSEWPLLTIAQSAPAAIPRTAPRRAVRSGESHGNVIRTAFDARIDPRKPSECGAIVGRS